MSEMVLPVRGMTCSACEESIGRAVARVPGVRSVRADHRAARVAAAFEPPANAGAVRSAIEGAGYDVDEAG